MKFAHLADCHLGSWKVPELQELNLQSFKMAMDACIKRRVDFVILAGDLFDSAYPPIEILKETFSEFKKLKEARIPCYIVAGSHDFSVSGKSFLDVLEKAGFCKNVFNSEIRKEGEGEKEIIILNPIIHENVAIYGYPGKKSGLEIEDLRRMRLQASPGFFKILMLHTSIKEAVGDLPIDYIGREELPKADYYALGHLHICYKDNMCVYPGPTFPNNFQELEELKHGTFFISEIMPAGIHIEQINLKIKEVVSFDIEIDNSLTGTEKIISELEKQNLSDKIVLLKLKGLLKKGKVSDIKFLEIESFLKSRGAFCFLKNTSKLESEEPEIRIETQDMDKAEDIIIEDYIKKNPSKFDNLVRPLMNALSIEKQEDEKIIIFENRVMEGLKKTIVFL